MESQERIAVTARLPDTMIARLDRTSLGKPQLLHRMMHGMQLGIRLRRFVWGDARDLQGAKVEIVLT